MDVGDTNSGNGEKMKRLRYKLFWEIPSFELLYLNSVTKDYSWCTVKQWLVVTRAMSHIAKRIWKK